MYTAQAFFVDILDPVHINLCAKNWRNSYVVTGSLQRAANAWEVYFAMSEKDGL